MVSQRGAANIRTYNKKRSGNNISRIKVELENCKKKRMQFNSLGSLAAYLQSVTQIHRTTFIRNSSYKILLANHLADKKGIAHGVADEHASALILQARLLAGRLEISNLKQHVRRLDAFIEKSGQESPPSELTAKISLVGTGDFQCFVDTAMTLVAVLDRYKETISIDFLKREIIDRAARPSSRVIVGPNRTTAFIEWLDKNRHFLFGIPKE